MAEEWSWPGKGEVRDPDSLKRMVEDTLGRSVYPAFLRKGASEEEQPFCEVLERVHGALSGGSVKTIVDEGVVEHLWQLLGGLKGIAGGTFLISDAEWERVKDWNQCLTRGEQQMCMVLDFDLEKPRHQEVYPDEGMPREIFDRISQRIEWRFYHISVLNQFRSVLEKEVAPHLPEKERDTEGWKKSIAAKLPERRSPFSKPLKGAIRETLDKKPAFLEYPDASNGLRTMSFDHVLYALKQEMRYAENDEYGDLSSNLMNFLTGLDAIKTEKSIRKEEKDTIINWRKLITKCEGMFLNRLAVEIDDFHGKIRGKDTITHREFESIIEKIDKFFVHVSALNQFRGTFEAKVGPLLPEPERGMGRGGRG